MIDVKLITKGIEKPRKIEVVDRKPGFARVKVEPFGNVRTDKTTGQAEVQEIREPMVDIFEEKGFVLVVAEMPGIGSKDVRIDLKDDVLAISAAKGDKKYKKEILLPGNFSPEKMTVSCNNGVVEVKLLR